MTATISPTSIYTISDKVVPRKIKGKLIVVPIEDGVANFNDSMFSFNETGVRVWDCIEQKQSVESICATLSREYKADADKIEQGVIKLLQTLVEKGIIEACKN